MYITEYLPYDYNDKRDEEKINFVMKILKQSLPDEKSLEGFLQWRGFTMTGEIEKKFLSKN